MKFHTWVARQYLADHEKGERWTPESHLAEIMAGNRSFLQYQKCYKDYKEMLELFYGNNQRLMDAFEECWKEWLEYERKTN